MKRLFLRSASLLTAASLAAGIMPAAAMAADDEVYTLSNDYIKVEVSGENGGFHIGTVQGDKLEKDDDNKMLLHNSSDYDTSFTSFRITKDGESKDYIFGRSYGFLGLSGTDITTVKNGNRIVSTWTVEDIEITQNIELANAASAENGMVVITYTAQNNGSSSAQVNARIMLDTALGYQDYAYYMIPDGGTYVTIENEQIIDGSSYGHMMFGYDDEFTPDITAYTVNASVNSQECVPTQVAFGHWNNLAATVYDFTPNESLTFTNEYNVQYLTADSAYALYYDAGTIEPGASGSIATNYGVYSNASTAQTAKMSINISGAEPLQLSEDKSTYLSPTEGGTDGEITLTATMKNFEREGAETLDDVRVVVYSDEQLIPIDEKGSTEDENGEYGSSNPYSVGLVDVQVNETITEDFRFKVPVEEKASYRKVELVAYEPSENTDVLLQDDIIGRQTVYILCPGSDNGVPDVVLTGCTEYLYYYGKQRLCATGTNLEMLGDQGSYNLRLEQITEDGTNGAVIGIDSSNVSVNAENNTIDITVPAYAGGDNTLPLGTYRLVIDYVDDAREDVVSEAAKVIVTDDAKYKTPSYGIVTVEQTVQPANGDVSVCRYEVKVYEDEAAYESYLASPDGQNSEILVVLKGDFSERRSSTAGYYYEATVIESNGEPVNPVTLNDTLELRSGSIRVTSRTNSDWGTRYNESDYSIEVDVDGDMRMAGTGTRIYDGTAALTEIKNSRDYDLRKYTTDGIRCSTLDRSDPRFQNMANKETITYVWSKVFDAFVSLASIVNADLTYGELGSMVDMDNNEITKLVSFGAKIDLGVIIPKGSPEFKENFDSSWVAYRKELTGAVGSAFSNLSIDNASALRSTWRDFKNSDYSTQYAARRSRGLIQACAEVEDVLFGGGDFIGVNFSVDIGVPPLTTSMPGISGTLTVNTMGNWRFGVDGFAEFGGLTVEATIELFYSQEHSAPIPDTLYLFIEMPPPGLNIDGFGVIWLRGGGGGIKDLYEAVYCPVTLPSTSIVLSVSASIIQVLTAKINLELGLTGISVIAERAVINETNIQVLRNSGISFQWYPSFKFTGQVNVDLLGILRGGGYIVIDPAMSAYEFYAMVSLMIPQFVPIVGGKAVGGVGVGINQDKIWGKVTIIGLSFGILYYWGGDFSFKSGNGSGLEPSYPELLSADDVAVGYDAETGRTLYAHVIPNYGLVTRAQSADSSGNAAQDNDNESGATLFSNADKTGHTLNLGTYSSDNGALNITYAAENIEEAYELARQVSITSGGTAYPIMILEEDESNADSANAFVSFTAPAAEDGIGEARLVVSFTNEDDFNKEWSITTPVSSALELYSVEDLAEFSLTGGSISDGKANISWTVNNGALTDLEKITVYAVTDEDYEAGNDIEGVLIGTITDTNILTTGRASLDLPADMQSGEYHIKAVGTHSESLIDSVTLTDTFAYTNPNQPQAAESAAVSGAGDYRLRVSLTEPDSDCDGYLINLYEVSTEDNGQTVYTQLDDVAGARFDTGDDLVVGGRYALEPDRSDPEASEETQYIGLEPGKTYAVGVQRVKHLTDSDGNITAEVMSEEVFSEGIVLSQPVTPNVITSVSASDGTEVVNLSAGMAGDTEILVPTVASNDVNVTLNSDMPVSGTWYIDSISYDDARKQVIQGGAIGTYGEFNTGEGNTAVISLTGLETQQHTLHIEGTNAAGDAFTDTVSFAVDTEAPTLAVNGPINGSITESDKITIVGRTDPDAVLKVEVNGKIVGEQAVTGWNGGNDDGTFEFTVDADPAIMSNRITLTAVDEIGNETEYTTRVVNERISKLTGVRMFIDGVDVTNTEMNSRIAMTGGTLELRGLTSDDETFVINDDTNIEWTLNAVSGNAQISEDGISVLSYDANSRGMVVGMFRLTGTDGMTAAASYGVSGTHQVTFDAPEHGHITVEPENAAEGDTVTVTFTAQENYPFRGWSSNNAEVEFADPNALTTTFTMPNDDVHVTAAYVTDSQTTVSGNDVVYGDKLTLTAKVEKAPIGINAEPGMTLFADTNKVEFFAGNTLLGTANVVYSDNNDGGKAELVVDTTAKQLVIGENKIRAEYGGSVNLNGSGSDEITVNMSKRTLEYSVTAENKVYDGTTAVNVTLTPTNVAEGDTVTMTAVGNVPSADTGNYTTVDLTSIKFEGTQSDYYTVAETAQGVILSKAVTIEQSDSGTTVSGSNVVYGDKLTLTADVSRTQNDGGMSLMAAQDKVEFFAGNTLLGTADVVYNDNNDRGKAELVVDTTAKQLVIGENRIRAEYGGSVNLNGSNSNEITVNMEAKTLEYTVSAENKLYDGTTAVNVTLTPANLVTGDTVTMTASGNVSSANVGDYTTVDLTGIKLDGAQMGYYSAAETVQAVVLTVPVTIEKAQEKTEIKIDYSDMMLTGLIHGGAYVVNGREITAETGTLAIADEWLGTELSIVKKAADDNHSDSETQMISIPTIPKAPEGVKGINSRGSNNAGRITGLNSGMEYRLTPDGEWTRVEGDTATGLVIGTYEVRTAATENSFPSETVTVTIKRNSSSGGSTGGSGGIGTTVQTPTPTPTAEPTEAPSKTPTPSETTEPTEIPRWFEDVPEDKWYYEPIKSAFDNDLMNGVSDTLFAPETDITRAMFVTVLYRMDGSPEAETDYTFKDVQSDSYYSQAVAWADDNSIVLGYSAEEFAPDDTITREQMAAIIYRYAAYLGHDIAVTSSGEYVDAEAISDYAVNAVGWVTDNGIMQGRDDNMFVPADHTTRAEAAAVFERSYRTLK